MEAFARESESDGGVLIGSGDEILLAEGANALLYGQAGAGKTTLTIDAAAHLASGSDWLGFPVPRPLRVLLIENEGPRSPFRRKLQRKIESWQGEPFAHNVFVVEQPWAAFSFAHENHRNELRKQVAANEIDLLVAGPLVTLGMVGGGTPDEVSTFDRHLVSFRAGLEREVAIWLVHHENKVGDVSGAWERWPDTLAHLRSRTNARATLHWRKVRWASRTHGSKMNLSWFPATEGFIPEESAASRRPSLLESSAEARAWIRTYVAEHPGLPRGKVEGAYADAHDGEGRNSARRVIDEALSKEEGGEHCGWLATATGERRTGTYLNLAAQAVSPLAATLFGENGE